MSNNSLPKIITLSPQGTPSGLGHHICFNNHWTKEFFNACHIVLNYIHFVLLFHRSVSLLLDHWTTWLQFCEYLQVEIISCCYRPSQIKVWANHPYYHHKWTVTNICIIIIISSCCKILNKGQFHLVFLLLCPHFLFLLVLTRFQHCTFVLYPFFITSFLTHISFSFSSFPIRPPFLFLILTLPLFRSLYIFYSSPSSFPHPVSGHFSRVSSAGCHTWAVSLSLCWRSMSPGFHIFSLFTSSFVFIFFTDAGHLTVWSHFQISATQTLIHYSFVLSPSHRLP